MACHVVLSYTTLTVRSGNSFSSSPWRRSSVSTSSILVRRKQHASCSRTDRQRHIDCSHALCSDTSEQSPAPRRTSCSRVPWLFRERCLSFGSSVRPFASFHILSLYLSDTASSHCPIICCA